MPALTVYIWQVPWVPSGFMNMRKKPFSPQLRQAGRQQLQQMSVTGPEWPLSDQCSCTATLWVLLLEYRCCWI